MHGVKAEGGWGVVCTEYCSVHPSSDDHPFPHESLWDEGDIKNLRLITDAVHESLAGVEIWYGGRSTANLYGRKASFGPSSLPILHWSACRYSPRLCLQLIFAN